MATNLDKECIRAQRKHRGIETCRRFYDQCVRPAVQSAQPGLPHAAALLGRGSEVLGFDDDLSQDHDWSARVLIFLENDQLHRTDDLQQVVQARIPDQFEDHPTALRVTAPRPYLQEQLGIETNDRLTASDWLTLPEHRLRAIAGGTVYHDRVGLQDTLGRLARYPDDVWRYLLLAGWWRIHPEANLVGRTGSVGDELGSAIIGAGLVEAMMKLCFLMEREYAPYTKWFGTAFARLDCAPTIAPILDQVIESRDWRRRETALNDAYRELARMHNELQITDPVSTEVTHLWDRPFGVLWGDFPAALRASITDPEVRRIADRWPAGAIDQVRNQIWAARFRRDLLALVDGS